MAKNKKKVIVIILAVVVGLGIISFGVAKAVGNEDKGEAFVTVVNVEKEAIESNIISDGIIKTKEQRNIVSNLPYTVQMILSQEGDKVSEGDTLAILDTQDLQYKVKVAEANLDIEKKKYEDMIKGTDSFQLEKNVENTKIAYENAVSKYESSQKLFKAGAISQSQLDMDKSSMITAKNNYELAEKQLDDATKGKDAENQKKKIELETLNLDLQKKALEESTIKSPISGTIVLSNAKIGVPANTMSPMFIIDDIQNLEIEINISEYDINSLKIGQEVKITGDAFKGNEFKGKIAYIAPTATIMSTNAGRETNVKVRIDILNPTEVLKPGFSADVSINTAKKDEALVVPYETLYQRSDGTTVIYMVDETSTIKEVPVEVGIEGDLKVEVLADCIKEGSKIVSNPNDRIKDGMKVNVMNKGEAK